MKAKNFVITINFPLSTGIQGHTISIDDFGDAEANYTVLALKDDPEEIHFRKSMRPVAHFTANGGVIPVSYFLILVYCNST